MQAARISTFCTGFEAACTSTDDHGWPRFTSQSALAASMGSLLEAVYGELPSTYPVCVYDFWYHLGSISSSPFLTYSRDVHRYLDKTAFFAAGLDKIVNKPSSPTLKLCKRAIYSVRQVQGLVVLDSRSTTASGHHPEQHLAGDPAHGAEKPAERIGSASGGTNVWFNVGRTIIFPGDEHATAIRVLRWLLQDASANGYNWSRMASVLCAEKVRRCSHATQTSSSSVGLCQLVGSYTYALWHELAGL